MGSAGAGWWMLLLALCMAIETPLSAFGATLPSDLRLVQVQIAFRHGDRTPLHALGNGLDEPWNCSDGVNSQYPEQHGYAILPLQGHPDTLMGNCFAGQLTSRGHDQLRAVGQYFGSAYRELMSMVDQESFVVRTDMIQRTVDSAVAFLEGLSPPFTVKALYQVDPSFEDMSVNPTFCPSVARHVVRDLRQFVPVADLILPHALELMEIFHTDDPFLPVRNFDNLFCRTQHGMPLPPGLTPNLYDTLEQAHTLVSTVYINDTYLAMGPFFKSVIEKMMRNSGSPEVFVYSGHDSTVAPIMMTLDIFKHWPQYGDHVAFELLQSSSQPSQIFVQVRYNADIVMNPQPLSVFAAFFLRDVPGDMAKYCAAV